jgi:predicted transposase/invertase (TIGR01784 family)
LNPVNIQEFPVDKQIVLDVLVEDEVGSLYVVEVQRYSHTGFFDRMLFGWAETYSARLQRGDGYAKLRPVRSIIIVEFPVFPSLKQLHAIFELRAREDSAVLLSDHCQIHVLRLGDLVRNNLEGLDQFDLNLQRWMQFWVFGSKLEEAEMSAMLQDCPPVQAAHEEFRRFTADPAMQEKVRARERFLIHQQLTITSAREEGEAKGRTEGRAEGLTEGEAKKARETATIMKQEGFDSAVIVKITGLPLSEIERLG